MIRRTAAVPSGRAPRTNEELAIQRYLNNPDAEVADLDRDLDRTMRGIDPGTWDDCPFLAEDSGEASF